MRSYSYTRRRGYIKIILILVVVMAMVYYVHMSVKCLKHGNALVHDRMINITFNIND
jgi:hypothetical protein